MRVARTWVCEGGLCVVVAAARSPLFVGGGGGGGCGAAGGSPYDGGCVWGERLAGSLWNILVIARN